VVNFCWIFSNSMVCQATINFIPKTIGSLQVTVVPCPRAEKVQGLAVEAFSRERSED
jgi:hypothetical protein